LGEKTLAEVSNEFDLTGDFRQHLDTSFERERLFREDYSKRLIEELREKLDTALERERLFREDFTNSIVGELKAHVDNSLSHWMTMRHPIALPNSAPVFTHTLDGHRILLDPSEPYIMFHVLEHGEWERHVRQLMRCLLSEGDIYWDIGANIGLHALLAAALVGKDGQVLSIEPHPNTFALLRENIEINGLNNRVELIQAAAADNHGSTRMFEYYEQHSAMSGFQVSDKSVRENGAQVTQIEVPIVALDVLIHEKGVRPDVVKIDVEGFEMDVLQGTKGLLESDHDVAFIVEYNSDLLSSLHSPATAKAILNLFADNGFEGFKVTDDGGLKLEGLGKIQAGIMADILFIRKNSRFAERLPLDL
jgi:FkbM family methyltransferase